MELHGHPMNDFQVGPIKAIFIASPYAITLSIVSSPILKSLPAPRNLSRRLRSCSRVCLTLPLRLYINLLRILK